MRNPLVRAAIVILAILMSGGPALIFRSGIAEASPAYPVVKQFQQPDGTTIDLRLWGDEFAHGWETLDGHTVAKNSASGYWEYAVHDGSGQLTPSRVVVGRGAPPAAPKVRPTLAAQNAARAARGAPPLGSPTLAAAPPWAGPDTDVLFIFVGFTDVGCTFTPALMQANMFGKHGNWPRKPR